MGAGARTAARGERAEWLATDRFSGRATAAGINAGVAENRQRADEAVAPEDTMFTSKTERQKTDLARGHKATLYLYHCGGIGRSNILFDKLGTKSFAQDEGKHGKAPCSVARNRRGAGRSRHSPLCYFRAFVLGRRKQRGKEQLNPSTSWMASRK